MQKVLFPMLAIAVMFIISGCSLYGNTPSNPADPMVAPGTTVDANAINIQNFAFSPATLTVKKGATVTWTNNDSAPHQIKAATFNSSSFNKNQIFSFTFNDIGTFDYICSIHPSMKGRIIVE